MKKVIAILLTLTVLFTLCLSACVFAAEALPTEETTEAPETDDATALPDDEDGTPSDDGDATPSDDGDDVTPSDDGETTPSDDAGMSTPDAGLDPESTAPVDQGPSNAPTGDWTLAALAVLAVVALSGVCIFRKKIFTE